ncbi:COG4705 family protein [Lysobacter claricitrinus]|uniref:COG4705 family protein n=1 Tax=Lysobacter claricitrinus TaxID=3367728 RepID=UPI0037DAE276
MTDARDDYLSKVPAITLTFWIIKILATTLGEIGGDAVTMSWLGETTPNASTTVWASGYLIGTAIFAAIFAAAVALQIRARRFNPWMYWTTIVASTTVGTTLADFADRSLGIGYTGGSSLLLALLLASLFTWYRTTGTIAVDSVRDTRSELFYWLTITFSQTLGTALGDWVADTQGLGYVGGIAIFGGLLALVAVLYFTTRVSRTALFWAAFVLTRPLGAVVGDFLDKPIAKGGLELSRYTGSLALVAAIVVGILVFPQRAADKAH